ncbi:MAG: hypothetical protein AAF511_05880 [Pseudomonadota bacterium]
MILSRHQPFRTTLSAASLALVFVTNTVNASAQSPDYCVNTEYVIATLVSSAEIEQTIAEQLSAEFAEARALEADIKYKEDYLNRNAANMSQEQLAEWERDLGADRERYAVLAEALAGEVQRVRDSNLNRVLAHFTSAVDEISNERSARIEPNCDFASPNKVEMSREVLERATAKLFAE